VGNAHHQNWTNNLSTGDAGRSGLDTGKWTEHDMTDCLQKKRLYCFQQTS
jgi:hypothetical protein